MNPFLQITIVQYINQETAQYVNQESLVMPHVCDHLMNTLV